VEISTEDSFSIIRSAEYILDGGNPVQIFPSDLLFDAGKETFRIELKGLQAGSHSLIVNATDDRGNRGTSQTTFEVE